MSTTPRTQCKATRRDGQPCQAFAIGTAGYCLSHDPSRAAQVAASRRAGGRARHGRKVGTTGTGSAVALQTLQDVLTLLAGAVGDCLQLENSLSRSRTVGYLCGVWASCYESSELEARVAALELKGGNA